MRTDLKVILDSLVRLTEQRQLDSLTKSLVSTVQQFVTPLDVQIFDIHISSSELEEVALPEYFSLSHNPYGNSNDDSVCEEAAACFTKCVSSQSTCYSNDLIPALIAIPIKLNSCVVKVLWVKLECITEHNLGLLKGLAKVFENFLAIVIECETDELTGLLNRKAFGSRLRAANTNLVSIEQAKIKQLKHHWLCIFDIDKFKLINDSFGHLYGDEILLDLVRVMRSVFDEEDAMFRFGGDEFVLLIAPSTKHQMLTKCQKFSDSLYRFHGEKVRLTVSMGITQICSDKQANTLLIQADQALYYIKETGRNRIEVYEDLVSRGALSEKKFDDDIEIF
ncbi:diguanylate cyclase (GGDEF) domain-containing protein [Shewanella psychrophila]|uniref:diguanylate cyclase n=1 Tax=Shewanella psychrophila TaxID=225848 RepID=A0A1S6HVE6_9GAMM|nr:GGDEF domain-containing protein [Shewanella psychrophila]AQS39398.1 diguanylate cyclase (GGDEF) domain-containing protein [Shewanella psychrophila]